MAARRRIAIIDDDQELLASLAEFLESFGFEVERFGSAEAFLSAAGALTRCDAIVSDMQMPGIGGCELARRLAETEPLRPIILITAFAFTDELLPLGNVRRILAKPFDPAVLLAALEEVRADR